MLCTCFLRQDLKAPKQLARPQNLWACIQTVVFDYSSSQNRFRYLDITLSCLSFFSVQRWPRTSVLSTFWAQNDRIIYCILIVFISNTNNIYWNSQTKLTCLDASVFTSTYSKCLKRVISHFDCTKFCNIKIVHVCYTN